MRDAALWAAVAALLFSSACESEPAAEATAPCPSEQGAPERVGPGAHSPTFHQAVRPTGSAILLDTRTVAAGADLHGLAEGLYAGHSMASGNVRVPVAGRRRTRTEAFVIARVERGPSAVVVTERTCAVEIGTVSGVSATMSRRSAASLPETTIRFLRRGNPGTLRAVPWKASWGEDDLDGDGNPGVSISIRAPLCRGEIYVASETRGTAEGEIRGGALEGRITLRVHQRILDASRRCLRWITSDSIDHLEGRFRYVPVSAGTTCSDLLSGPWPGRLKEPD